MVVAGSHSRMLGNMQHVPGLSYHMLLLLFLLYQSDNTSYGFFMLVPLLM